LYSPLLHAVDVVSLIQQVRGVLSSHGSATQNAHHDDENPECENKDKDGREPRDEESVSAVFAGMNRAGAEYTLDEGAILVVDVDVALVAGTKHGCRGRILGVYTRTLCTWIVLCTVGHSRRKLEGGWFSALSAYFTGSRSTGGMARSRKSCQQHREIQHGTQHRMTPQVLYARRDMTDTAGNQARTTL